jgi:hypothetical protein
MVTGADKLVILVSPDSVRSEVCRRDLEFAEKNGKSLFPVLVNEVPLDQIPKNLARRNIVFMRNEEEFARGMPALVMALATDLGWVREHTRLQELAFLWERRKRSSALLLRGESLKAAEEWLAHRPASGPLPTAIQREFIDTARRVQLSKARRVSAMAMTAAVVALVLAGTALWQRQVAIVERTMAEQQFMLARQQSAVAERSGLRVRALEDALRQVDANNPLLRQ